MSFELLIDFFDELTFDESSVFEKLSFIDEFGDLNLGSQGVQVKKLANDLQVSGSQIQLCCV